MELAKTDEEAKELLSGNREVMDKLAAYLIEKETISGKEFMKIYRQEKGIPEPEEEDKAEIPKEESADASVESEQTKAEDDFFKKADDVFFADTKSESQQSEKVPEKEAEVPELTEVERESTRQETEVQEAPVAQEDSGQPEQKKTAGRFSNVPSDF